MEPTAIELGDFRIITQTPLNEIAWFLAGLLFLTGLTITIMWWMRQSHPDPFAPPEE